MTVIHYDNGKHYIMPVSGQHTICLCGRWLHDSYKPDLKRKTTNAQEVTCKNSLKMMAKIKII